MTRNRKLLTATCILGLGFLLAWPFRRPANQSDSLPLPEDRPSEPIRASNGDAIVAVPSTAPSAMALPMVPTVAHMASTAESVSGPSSTQQLNAFDLANHPALSEQINSKSGTTASVQTAETVTRPAYTTVGEQLDDSSAVWRDEVLHIVANGDTLEKLAERYLKDAGRAMEIFDMNRDQLNNPHLLPIGVELRVPVSSDRIID